MIATVLYILATVCSNYLYDWFLPLPIFGLVSLGTLTFAATFTLRDYMHSRGKAYVYRAILLAALGNTLAAWALSIEWRIILASFLAILVAESADTEIFQTYIQRSWWLRVLASNAVSVPLDSTIFTCIAFAGLMTWHAIAAIIFGDIIVKYAMAGLLAIRATTQHIAVCSNHPG